MDNIYDTSQLSDKEIDIYLAGYRRAMVEMEGMKKELIHFINNYVYHHDEQDELEQKIMDKLLTPRSGSMTRRPLR